MGRLIEEQAVIDCLTNTAKYYEMDNADEWTKGIHYGLLHGLDNILDDVKEVEAIPKADYEARLKADMIAMLNEIQLEIEELYPKARKTYRDGLTSYCEGVDDSREIIQQKINAL